MDCEQKYKEALERARQEYNTTENVERKQWLEELFPELAESENERIRKGIIRNLEYLADRAEGFVKDELKERIAWLEKQGFQKPTDNDMKELLRTEYEKGRADAIAEIQNPVDCIDCTNSKGCINCEDGNMKETLVRKTAWSEEDEEELDIAISTLKEAGQHDSAKWLKSLKERCTWTRTDVFIEKACDWLEDNIDRYLYNTGGYGEYIPKCGGKMYEDFKKAMEE